MKNAGIPSKLPAKPVEKQNLHPRNLHRFPYDFKVLVKGTRELAPFVFINAYKNETIDFANPEAVKMLNKAILKHFYKIGYWDIPPHYLCPPIPGRADYIHYLADLLAGEGPVPHGAHITGFDVGMGANCVYPIIGHQSYGWRFCGSDVDPVAVASAQKTISQNASLAQHIECRLQKTASSIFDGAILPNEKFDFTMCNPPFHASAAEAAAATQRKWQNLGNKSKHNKSLNFGGQHAELWYPGGELAFLTRMIEQSVLLDKRCFWFTSLVSKKTSLPRLYQSLKKAGVTQVKTIGMAQGQKVSRMLAWTYLDQLEQDIWKKERWTK